MAPSRAINSWTLGVTVAFCITCCRPGSFDANEAWTGTMDTLASGEIVVRNTEEPLWDEADTWQFVEEIRVGTDTNDEAPIFGDVISFDVDGQGRIFVLDFQAQEISIFDSDGTFVRTFGSKGTGPGEFEQALAVDINENGEALVMQMLKAQLSIFDPTGRYLRTESIGNPGVGIRPYPGGFDFAGRYNAVVVFFHEFSMTQAMARFDQSLTPLDTIAIPEATVEREAFTHVRDLGGGRSSSIGETIPFQGSFEWRFSPTGNLWTLTTKEYELVELSPVGQTLRRVSKEHDLVPVSEEEMADVREEFQWFINLGGMVDWSRIPNSKPAVVSFFCDDEGNLWVKREAVMPEDEGRLFDLFDPEGRYLGEVRLPFILQSDPEPIVRDGILYGVTTDELGAPNVVRARIEKP
ncbi:MAG: 6-bladed beta-propeller [Rhodothermaceae bacterium]|nr:6-bladed beta-propeller [Rhodothermaceae bacterium]MXX59190.1 6-bladed beta-propeller [Rhodothermaceae bacterium]MYD18296.1 6-bladed beta-propeller [Rhodothermaceae bacterium]MYI44178.1 6-bladed beta-propeller [Rhodothermaceae bacterium]